nr:MAG TPA: hypothetical protein [Bacteriophage sp.]
MGVQLPFYCVTHIITRPMRNRYLLFDFCLKLIN